MRLPRQIRLGLIVPSSNTALEPLTTTTLLSLPPNLSITPHFSRCRVTTISLSPTSTSQFSLTPMLAAAELLADAKVDVIGWSGTSAGWLGVEKDEELCAEIERVTGIRATSSTVGLRRILRGLAVAVAVGGGGGGGWEGMAQGMRLGLVTPYIGAVNDAIRRNFAMSLGVEVTEERERHLGLSDNISFADVGEAQLDGMVADVVGQGANVVVVFCTNLRAAQRVEHWEKLHGVLVFDSVETVLWDMLGLAGVSPSHITGWGKMFQIDHPDVPL